MRYTLFFSVFLHILFVLCVYRFAPKRSVNELPFVVEEFQGAASGHGGGAGGGHAAGAKKSGLAKITMRDLLQGGSEGEAPSSAMSGGKENGEGGGLGGTQLEGVGQTVVMDALYNRIDQAVFYPAEFVDAGIEGDVYTHLYFFDDGTLDLKKSLIQSRSSFLRVYIFRLLEAALKDPVVFAGKQRVKEIRCMFYFEVTRSFNGADWSYHAHHGAKRPFKRLPANFAFYRSSKVIGEWKLGPFAGYGIYPAVGIDPEWFYDKADRIIRHMQGKVNIDPLDKYREDPEWSKSD